MIKYCMRDVSVTEKLYEMLCLQLQMFDFSDTSVYLEHAVAHICKDQEDNGFAFNASDAKQLERQLETKMLGIEAALQNIFPPIAEEQRYHKTSGKPLPVRYTHFNVGSRQQIAEREEGCSGKRRHHQVNQRWMSLLSRRTYTYLKQRPGA